MTILFWICFALIVYVYCGYPLLLASGLLGRRIPVKWRRALPRISVLVPAHNEESVIQRKLENLLSLDYPRERYEIFVGSDGSVDRTVEIVKGFAASGVRLVESAIQQGKSAIQNQLVAQSSGELIVFTDADCCVQPQALRLLAENFADPDIGLATSQPSYTNRGETNITQGEGSYWRYERWLREQESDRRMLCMASGSFFGFRRRLWQPLDHRLSDDFVLPMRVALHGFRSVVESRVTAATCLTQKSPELSLQMRRRIVSKDWRGLYANRRVLSPLRTGRVALGLLSHKVLRWMVPVFLAGMILSNLFLLRSAFYGYAMAAQLAFYTIAVAGALRSSAKPGSLWSIPLGFCVMNLAALLGTLHFLSGRTIGQWRPVRDRIPEAESDLRDRAAAI